MENRIRIYSTLLAVVYCILIIFNIYEGVPAFIRGVENGYKEGCDNPQKETFHVHVSVEPKNGYYTHPDNLLNLRTGNYMPMEIESFILKVDKSKSERSWDILSIIVLQSFTSVILIAAMIYLPILFFKIIRNIIRGNIINNANVLNIRIIGCIIIIYFAVGMLSFDIGEPYMAKQYIQLQNYEIVYRIPDLTVLIFGIVTLLIAEILKMAYKMKEEQDLTV